MASDKKKSGKFFTTILIGGALGSVVAWAFGSRKRRDTITEKAQHYYEQTKEKILHPPEKPKRGFWSRLFGRKN
jgi:gas vesicle protein